MDIGKRQANGSGDGGLVVFGCIATDKNPGMKNPSKNGESGRKNGSCFRVLRYVLKFCNIHIFLN
jgi:hypothetical protein